MTRICLDSNVLVAAFMARGLCADLFRLVLSEHDLVILEVVAEEVRRILATKIDVSESALAAVEAVFKRCSMVPHKDDSCPISLRDPDDEQVLASALDAGAEILVSGDQALLVAAEKSPIRILSPRALLTLVRGGTM